jgi:hypothetical protein
MADRPTDAVFMDRVTTVYTDLVKGKRRSDILQYASKWGVTDRTIDNYIARANALLEEQAQIVRGRELGKANARYDLLFGLALDKDDLATALRAESERAKLWGLNAPTQTEITGADGGPIVIKGYASVSPDEWPDGKS